MKKLVPDPPGLTTVHTQFSTCNNGHKPLFAVCDGVDIEDALVHLSMILKSAFETNTQVCEQADRSVGGLAWATYHSLEISQALVESLLTGLARQKGSG
ncbi:DUF3077 domain-containing protein [Pseudomonas sp. 148P]|uniref:DUF3077 domain-containing protein n=1 Tax=Pseudomonas ulcerans TaxID=3115852 RepID=A0ABU7I245_9PSED|nr:MULTISPECIES: DUF3077 domain-containing protein [unclassified Pseudomonas]MEE1926457.1 DUF3077 domain-containing protein [Pseudomonas sp. 147P]MEE1937681.1 DUF3077 domain-containing protein [Pseudomonas sp. 148P]